MNERPDWQVEAEALADTLRREITSEIADTYSGDVRFYIHEKFGEEALESVLVIAEQTRIRKGLRNFEIEAALALQRYAINRRAFDLITEAQGYRQYSLSDPTLGSESVAVVTRSGSMLFAGPGSFNSEGQIGYLPISDRQIQATSGRGTIIPVEIVPEMVDGRILRYRGVPRPRQLPNIGQKLAIAGLEGILSTSPLVQVKMKHDTTEDYQPQQSMMHSLTYIDQKN